MRLCKSIHCVEYSHYMYSLLTVSVISSTDFVSLNSSMDNSELEQFGAELPDAVLEHAPPLTVSTWSTSYDPHTIVPAPRQTFEKSYPLHSQAEKPTWVKRAEALHSADGHQTTDSDQGVFMCGR